MSKRKPQDFSSGPLPVPLWMVTFSDVMGLLVCFFVMLIGFSAMANEDLSRAPGMLTGFPGISPEQRMGNDSMAAPQDSMTSQVHMSGYETAPEYDPLSYVRQGIDMKVQFSSAGNILQHRMTEKGLEVTIRAGELFAPESARFTPAGRQALDIVAAACGNLPNPLRVEAHADDFFVPSDKFRSAQDMAFRRTAAICRYLAATGRVAPERLAATMALNESDTLAQCRELQVKITVLRPARRRMM